MDDCDQGNSSEVRGKRLSEQFTGTVWSKYRYIDSVEVDSGPRDPEETLTLKFDGYSMRIPMRMGIRIRLCVYVSVVVRMCACRPYHVHGVDTYPYR